MFQLLIVDDEEHMVNSLAETIAWEGLEIAEVFKAYNAIEALQILETEVIDILITDIHMPGLSGLELIERIGTSSRNTKCILLSGYAEFAYAKQAIENKVYHYLIKPVDEEELCEVVRKLTLELKQEGAARSSHERTMRTLHEHLPQLRANLLLSLLQGYHYAPHSLKEKLALFNIPFSMEDHVSLVMIRMEKEFVKYDMNDLALLEYAVINILEEISNPLFNLWYCKDPHDYYVVLVSLKQVALELADPIEASRQKLVERIAMELQHNVKLYLKGTVSMLVSQWVAFPNDLTALYRASLSTFRKRIGNEHELFITINHEPKQFEMKTINHLYNPPLLKYLLEAGQWKAAIEKLDLIFEELSQNWSGSREHIIEVFLEIQSTFSFIVHKNGKWLAEIIYDLYEPFISGYSFQSIQHFKEWSLQVLALIQADMDNETKDSRVYLVKQIQLYIEKHLNTDVTASAIAEHVFLHPSYLSRVYKLETGENLSDYIFQVRMEKAILMLKDPSAKIYEISDQLGYQYTQYFIRMFKKHYGVTPQQFREKL